MKNLVIIICAVLVFSGCRDRDSGSGNLVTEKRNTGSFTKLNVSQNIGVEIKLGPDTDVRVEADDNIIRYVETSVENGELTIRLKNDINMNDTHIKVFLTVPEITSVEASSAANVEVKGSLVSKGELSFDASSAATITTSIDAPAVKATASSASEIKLSGRTRDFTANSSSGSNIKSFELLSENTTAEASSGSGIDTYASVSLDADASSGSNINYRGAAARIKKDENSGGSVNKSN